MGADVHDELANLDPGDHACLPYDEPVDPSELAIVVAGLAGR